MNSIDDLWDEPIAAASPRRQPIDVADDDDDDAPQPSKRPLFLDSGSDDDNTAGAKAPAEIDDLFKDIDAPDEGIIGLTPTLDLDALRRAASARHAINDSTPHEILPSSPAHKGGDGGDKWDDQDDVGTKKRKTIPRLDEGRLLSESGIPALMKDAKRFKAKGKGHEVKLPFIRVHSTGSLMSKSRRLISTAFSLCTNTGRTSCIRGTSLTTPLRGWRSYVIPDACTYVLSNLRCRVRS